MVNKIKHLRYIFPIVIGLTILLFPLAASAAFSCEWTGSTCQIDTDNYDCEEGASNHEQICQNNNTSEECAEDKNLSCHSSPGNVVVNYDLDLEIDYPPVPAPVPGGALDLNCFGGSGLDKCDSDYVFELSIGNVLIFIYSLAIWIAGIIAAISIVRAGFYYIISGAKPGVRNKVKGQFSNALWGIAIILLAVIALNTVNPDIAQLNITGQGEGVGGNSGARGPFGNLEIDYPEIPVPGGTFDLNDAWETHLTGGPRVTVGVIFAFIYTISIWASGIIALIVLVWNGAKFIISGTKPEIRLQAKGGMANAFWGIVIIFSTFIILNTLNPDITNLDITRTDETTEEMRPQEPITEGDNEEEEDEEPGTYTCTWNDEENICEAQEDNCEPGYEPECEDLNNESGLTSEEKESFCENTSDNQCQEE